MSLGGRCKADDRADASGSPDDVTPPSGTGLDNGSEQDEAKSGATGRLRWLVHYGAFVSIALFLILENPFQWEDITANASHDLFMRLVIGPLYPGSKRGPDTPTGHDDQPAEPTVVLFTEANLDQLGNTWPIPMRNHAEVLLAIHRHKPRAVFVDFVFTDARNDDNVDLLKQTIARYRASEIPLYFALADGERAAWIRPDLADSATLVSAAIPSDDAVARSYWPCRKMPLDGGSAAAPGLGAPCACADQADKKFGLCSQTGENSRSDIALSAAFRLYEDATGRRADFDPWRPIDMDVVWSNRVHELNRRWMRPTDTAGDGGDFCTDLGGGFRSWVWRAVSESERFRQPCPYTRTLSAGAVRNGVNNPDVKKALEDAVVLYSGDLVALGDNVSPPTNDPLPGVYLHAMALDNLLTFGGQYKKSAFSLFGWRLEAKWIEWFLMLVVAGVTVAYARSLAVKTNIEGIPAERRNRGHDDPTWRERRLWRNFLTAASAILLGITLALYFWVDISPRNWIGFFSLTFVFMEIASGRRVERFATTLCDRLFPGLRPALFEK